MMRHHKSARYAVQLINPERPYVPLNISQHHGFMDARSGLHDAAVFFDPQQLCIRDRETGKAWIPTYGGWCAAYAEAQHFGYDEALTEELTEKLCRDIQKVWDKERF